jgi:hypothetical protein
VGAHIQQSEEAEQAGCLQEVPSSKGQVKKGEAAGAGKQVVVFGDG